jgi:hypothetical protein
VSQPAPNKTVQKLLDRHAKLREEHSDAYAAVETTDGVMDGGKLTPLGERLSARRDVAFAKLAPVAAKLRERGYTLDHDDSVPVPPAGEVPGSKPKSSVTREQLEQAAALRADGATWNAIREATGTRLGSTAWFRYWERDGIEHRPAGAPKPTPEPAQPEPQPEPAEAASAKPSRSRATKKPPAADPKPKPTVRRSKSAT